MSTQDQDMLIAAHQTLLPTGELHTPTTLRSGTHCLRHPLRESQALHRQLLCLVCHSEKDVQHIHVNLLQDLLSQGHAVRHADAVSDQIRDMSQPWEL
jgi:hypothetical protein